MARALGRWVVDVREKLSPHGLGLRRTLLRRPPNDEELMTLVKQIDALRARRGRGESVTGSSRLLSDYETAREKALNYCASLALGHERGHPIRLADFGRRRNELIYAWRVGELSHIERAPYAPREDVLVDWLADAGKRNLLKTSGRLLPEVDELARAVAPILAKFERRVAEHGDLALHHAEALSEEVGRRIVPVAMRRATEYALNKMKVKSESKRAAVHSLVQARLGRVHDLLHFWGPPSLQDEALQKSHSQLVRLLGRMGAKRFYNISGPMASYELGRLNEGVFEKLQELFAGG